MVIDASTDDVLYSNNHLEIETGGKCWMKVHCLFENKSLIESQRETLLLTMVTIVWFLH